MKIVPLSLTIGVLSFCSVHADEDKTPHRRALSPRHSREGRVPFTANNVQLLSWLPLADLSVSAATGADCWGYTSPSGREYAIIGINTGTAFVEITDPGAPVLVAFRTGVDSLWRELMTYGDNAYVVSEGGGGVQVFDMSGIDSGSVTFVGSITTGDCTDATHTITIDEQSGFLYRNGGSSSPCGGGAPQGLVIYDLNVNPNNPPAVGLWTSRYVHDCQVVVSTRPGPLNGRQLAFCAANDGSGGGTPNLQILDVTNKASITTVATVSYTSAAFSHQVWLTPDQRYAYLNDELDEDAFGFTTRTRIFDVSNPAAPVFLGHFSSGSTSIDHNLFVTADKVFEANYRSGLRVFDITTPTAPTVYGYFDTYPEDDDAQFNGLWNNYPYFPSGTVIGSDIDRGLFVFRLGAPELSFDFPSGLPEFIGPGGGTVDFEVLENAPGDLQAGTVKFHYSTGGPFTTVNATHLGGDLYRATLPAASCGAALDFYVSAKSDDDVTWTDPPAGPTQVHLAVAAYGEIVAHTDDFEANTGWQVNVAADLTGFSTATTGTWVRANPVGTSAQPEDDHSNPGTQCFVTANGAIGGGVGDADIDSGATSIRSPVLDASGMSDPRISYWRWFSNSAGAGPGEDTMTVHVSNNGGTSWVLVETVGPTGPDVLGGWIQHQFRIADFVTPTNDMRLRFRASDLINGSIVEAAVDDLRILEYDCTPPSVTVASISPSSGPLDGGNLVTITGTGFQAGVTTVFFGTNEAMAVNVTSPTSLTARVPRGLAPLGGKLGKVGGRVDVTVQDPGSDVLPKAYAYGSVSGP